MKGSIEKLPSGRHRARRGKETVGTFDTRDEAKNALAWGEIEHVPHLIDALHDHSELTIGYHALAAWWRCFDEAIRVGTLGRVYVIMSDYDGLSFKFGFTRNMDRRFRDLQNQAPFTLRRTRDIPGSTGMERALHEELAPHRIRGEWYRCARDVFFAAMAVAFAHVTHADGSVAA